jgi:hypothetical protein
VYRSIKRLCRLMYGSLGPSAICFFVWGYALVLQGPKKSAKPLPLHA